MTILTFLRQYSQSTNQRECIFLGKRQGKDPDPDCEPGSRDPIESGSRPDRIRSTAQNYQCRLHMFISAVEAGEGIGTVYWSGIVLCVWVTVDGKLQI